jgi:beta-1,4-mannosyl-glycoprotein beta-1,4-N-acetylglucosaminyltransferase
MVGSFMTLIYDTFLFSNELELLEYRLWYLHQHVSYFVLVESPLNHRNQFKPLYYEENKSLFKKYKDQIKHLVIGDYGISGEDDRAASQREDYSRAYIDHIPFTPLDYVLYSDVDEIPRRESIARAKGKSQEHRTIVAFQQYLSYYFVNYRANPFWYGTKGAFKRDFQSVLHLRQCTINTVPFIESAGWHMSYCGGKQKIQEKLTCRYDSTV